jgi:D-serine deaminase-like pyridoxal phosphate-dependent protein
VKLQPESSYRFDRTSPPYHISSEPDGVIITGTMQRRTFISAALAAPTVLKGDTRTSSYSAAEVDRILARGDVGGKLTKYDLPTPALLIDLDAFEHNMNKMAAHCRASGRALRPHGKTHKCPEIARRLIAAGAVGACAAKLSEAEVFAANGVGGLLITTAVIGRHKIERAVKLATLKPDTIFCADNASNVNDLNEAAKSARRKLNVAVDLFISGRTGIQPGEAALSLAKTINGQSNLRFAGVQAYAGHASHTQGFEKRVQVSREAMGLAVDTRRMIEKSGIECPLLTGASTGTYNIDSTIEGVTELQPGSYIFMDLDYNRIGGRDGEIYRDFRNSLSVLTTVVSKPHDALAIVDGGLKAFSTDKPLMPEARGVTGISYAWGGDEHGRLTLANASVPANVGDRLEFIIPHCDPSVNLYDRYYCTRGDKVEHVWRIAARGMSQ